MGVEGTAEESLPRIRVNTNKPKTAKRRQPIVVEVRHAQWDVLAGAAPNLSITRACMRKTAGPSKGSAASCRIILSCNHDRSSAMSRASAAHSVPQCWSTKIQGPAWMPSVACMIWVARNRCRDSCAGLPTSGTPRRAPCARRNGALAAHRLSCWRLKYL